VSGGNMTVVVNNLEKEGLVKRKVSAEDRRAFYVSLTPKGKRLFDKIFIQHAEFVAKTVSVLTVEEQLELSRLLKKLGTGAVEQSPLK
jgi:MarR family 2-MHQ and catechol resistance regulon transcriptional repressor